jgi:hypothetical protein
MYIYSYTVKVCDTERITIRILQQRNPPILLEVIKGLRGYLRCAPEAPPADYLGLQLLLLKSEN